MLASAPELAGRLAVCSWSLEPASADDLLKKLAATGLRRVQIALDPVRVNAAGAWTDLAAKAAAEGVTFVSGMMGTIGEDYTTLDSIRRTGGVRRPTPPGPTTGRTCRRVPTSRGDWG